MLGGGIRVRPEDGEEGVLVPGGGPVPEHPLEGASRQVGDARGLLPGDGQVYGPDALPRPRVQGGEGVKKEKRRLAHPNLLQRLSTKARTGSTWPLRGGICLASPG